MLKTKLKEKRHTCNKTNLTFKNAGRSFHLSWKSRKFWVSIQIIPNAHGQFPQTCCTTGGSLSTNLDSLYGLSNVFYRFLVFLFVHFESLGRKLTSVEQPNNHLYISALFLHILMCKVTKSAGVPGTCDRNREEWALFSLFSSLSKFASIHKINFQKY